MSGLIGKRVKLFFDDTGKVLVKIGTIVDQDVCYTQIRTEFGVQAIPTNHVVRMEVLN